MENLTQTPDSFLEAQVEKLNKFKSEQNKEPIPSLNDAAKELANKPVVEEKKPEVKLDPKLDNKKEEVKDEKPVVVEKIIPLKNKEEKKEEVDADTKAHLDWLNKVDEESDDPKLENKDSKKESPNYEKEIEGYKTKVQEYEGILNDDYIKAVVEFRKNGGTDLSELNKYLGITDTKNLTIEDFYKEKAIAAGLKEDELKEAVDESIERYNSLPKLEQKEILNNFKNNLTKQTEEKIKSFSAGSQVQRQEFEKIQKESLDELQKEVESKIGKKWRGLLIDKNMSKAIYETVLSESYAKPIIKDGKITGYDVKNGVRLAILDKFEKQLYKTQYDLAHLSAYDKAIQERNRPSENMNGNEIVASNPNDIEKVTKEIREEQKKKQGLFKK